jgi:Protein of unknown function (DUF1501)
MSERNMYPRLLRANANRRTLLRSGVGLGAVALADCILGGALSSPSPPRRASASGPDLGAIGTGHFPARAKRVVSIHMLGAVSQVDTFDYKPELIKRHGEEIPSSVKDNGQRISTMSNGQTSYPILKPLWPYKRYGQSGTWASDLVKHIGSISDDLTFIHTMNTPHVNHDPAAVFLQTGFQLNGRPSAGAWINYALGTDNANLPAFVVMKSQGTDPSGPNSAMWGSGFLPSHHQGVEFRPGSQPVLYVDSPEGITRKRRREQIDIIGELARAQYDQTGDSEILSRISQYEMSYRMQQSVPEIADISDETDYVLSMYGPAVHEPGSFAHNALLTRRLLERGVKFVELIHIGWDHHRRIFQNHPYDCRAIDQPSAALVTDLKQRGLLEDTLVIFGAEFGRTSYGQGDGINDRTGRDHHGACFTFWLAGGGVKEGYHHGLTDDFSYNVVKYPVTVHDLHATMLYLLGIDHKQLIYSHQGRDFRLTDVAGEVISAVIA